MNKELLANIRNILIPTLASCLKRTNYEGQGEKDAIEFTHDITEIFDLAEQQLYAQPKWIPCSERLPEKDGEYLTTTEDGLCDVESYGDGEWFYDDVVAWAPLPEPWKGEET